MSARRLDLDFGPRRRRIDAVSLLLLLAGGTVAALAMLRVSDALSRHAELREALTSLDRGSRPRSAVRPSAEPALAAQWRTGRQVADGLQSPWADLLEAIERRPATDVALLAVEPSAPKRQVRITAEARSVKAMLEHLALLQGDNRLTQVVLASHQQQLQAAGTPWRYQIQAAW